MAQIRSFIYYTHTEACVTLVEFSSSAASIYEYMNI